MSTKTKTKEELTKSSEDYQKALQQDVDLLLERSKDILIGAAVVGAGFWVAYKLFKSFSSDDDKSHNQEKEYHEPSSEPGIMDVVKQTIMKELAIFLLGIIKEKVIEYMQSVSEEDEENT